MAQQVRGEDGGEEDSRSGHKVRVYGTVDGGWAWVVLAAMTFWNALIAGTFKSFGVIYLEFLDRYSRGPVATSWLGFSFSFITTLIAPISGYIGDHVSLRYQRVIVMCLSVVISVCVAVTGSMSTLEGAILTYGLAGVAVSLVDTPILSLIGKYFRKRRFLAAGFVSAGSSLGTLVLPLLITFVVREYSISGGMVVFGALWLNTFVVGAVIRPLRPYVPSVHVVSEAEDGTEKSPAKECLDENTNKIASEKNENNSEENKAVDQDMVYEKKTHNSSLSLDVLPNGLTSFLDSSNLSLDKQFIKRKHLNHTQYSSSVPSSPHIHPKSDNKRLFQSLHEISDKIPTENECLKEKDVEMTRQLPETSSSSRSGGCDECHSKSPSLGKKLVQIMSGYWKFLTSPGLPILIFSFTVASFAYFNQFFLLPPFGQEVGMSRVKGASLVSISNATELASRLLVGVLVDRKLIRKSVVVKTSFAVAAVGSVAVSFFPQATVLYVYAGVFGLFGGVFIVLSLPLMIELVKDTQVASATGVFVLVTGTGISLGPPILGLVRELSGSYVDCFRVCGACYVISFLLYLVHNGDIPFCCRPKDKFYHRSTIVEEEIV